MKKKVLHIVESFASGVFSFLVDLVNSTDKDYEIVIAYGERKETQENFKEYFNKNIKFIKVENFTRSINPIKDIKRKTKYNEHIFFIIIILSFLFFYYFMQLINLHSDIKLNHHQLIYLSFCLQFRHV